MVDSDVYDEFVATSPQGSIFCTSWWLDAVAPGSHGSALVVKDGRIEAAWPYALRHTLGRTIIDMPPLTPWLGVVLRPMDDVKLSTRLAREKDLVLELAAALPAASIIRARCHRRYAYWAPLSWSGFTQTTRYTFVLPDLTRSDRVWAGFRDNIRTDIRKAERVGVTVDVEEGLDAFWSVHQMTFARQGIAVPYDRALVARLDAACAARGRRRIFVARGADGTPHAVAYIVWDKHSAYYLMGGGDPELRSSGATSLVLWSAIQFAATVAPAFDFEGSMIEPVERFVRAFGAQPESYSAIERVTSPSYIAYRAIRQAAALARRRR
jgi:GNAT acetyltransferase-like protein